MKRPFVLTGAVLSATALLTGCGGKKQASTIAASVSPRTAHPTGAAARSPAPRGSMTVRGTVKVGQFCGVVGTVGRTDKGTWARCGKHPGDKRPRWYPQAPGGGVARAGQFCSTVGATAKSSTGATLRCSKNKGETRARWHTK
jgi:hypothetical protein